MLKTEFMHGVEWLMNDWVNGLIALRNEYVIKLFQIFKSTLNCNIKTANK